MSMTHTYAAVEPARLDVDGFTQPTVLEFGTGWCGFCRGAQPLIAAVFDDHPEVDHQKVEDGKGRPLGRSYHVTLWPTLIFLREGKEVARVVRPRDKAEIARAFAALDPALGGAP